MITIEWETLVSSTEVPGHGNPVRTTLLMRRPRFRTVRRMEPTSRDDLDERFESLPWEQVRGAGPPDRRWVVIVAGAVVVAAITASATRTLWPAQPLSAPVALPPTTAAIPATTAPAPAGLHEDHPVTEADLRAIAPEDAARAVAAHAEWFVSEWLTLDGELSEVVPALLPEGVGVPVLDESARSFVESAVALSVEDLGFGSWEVAVLVRSLSAFGESDYLRIPARVFLVSVGIGEEGPFVTDLPAPGPLPSGRASTFDLVDEPAPDGVVDAAITSMREAGLPDESTIATGRLGQLWRVSAVVRDRAGVPFVVAVWIDDSGERVPAPG